MFGDFTGSYLRLTIARLFTALSTSKSVCRLCGWPLTTTWVQILNFECRDKSSILRFLSLITWFVKAVAHQKKVSHACGFFYVKRALNYELGFMNFRSGFRIQNTKNSWNRKQEWLTGTCYRPILACFRNWIAETRCAWPLNPRVQEFQDFSSSRKGPVSEARSGFRPRFRSWNSAKARFQQLPVSW